MLYGCVTWSPRACHYDTLRRPHHRFLIRCIGWRKHNRADHPISYLDTLIKAGSESIEATLRREADLVRGICGAYGKHGIVEVRDVRRNGGGRGLCEGAGKRWMGCFLDDLKAFGTNADQWTTADEGDWRKTAKRGAEHFMAKWIAVEKTRAGL